MSNKKKVDFTQQEATKYAGIIGGIDINNTNSTSDTENTIDTKNTKGNGGRKGYFDGNVKKEYRFTCRLTGISGAFLQEWAWRDRTTITQKIQDLVNAAMEEHPEVFDSMNSLNNGIVKKSTVEKYPKL